jgi:hypothetical protein
MVRAEEENAATETASNLSIRVWVDSTSRPTRDMPSAAISTDALAGVRSGGSQPASCPVRTASKRTIESSVIVRQAGLADTNTASVAVTVITAAAGAVRYIPRDRGDLVNGLRSAA